MSTQGPAKYWGTGADLSSLRSEMDGQKATMLFVFLGRRIHGLRFDYQKSEFRSLYHDITVTLDGVDHSLPAIEHLMSETGLSE